VLRGMTAHGAQRKHVTLPTDFRSPSVNGHSCYGHLTARFAPFRPLPNESPKVREGGAPRDGDRDRGRCRKVIAAP